MEKEVSLLDLDDFQSMVDDEEITQEEADIARDIKWGINDNDIPLFIEQMRDHLELKEISSVTYADPNNDEFGGAYAVTTKDGDNFIYAWKDFELGLTQIKSKSISEDKKLLEDITEAKKKRKKRSCMWFFDDPATSHAIFNKNMQINTGEPVANVTGVTEDIESKKEDKMEDNNNKIEIKNEEKDLAHRAVDILVAAGIDADVLRGQVIIYFGPWDSDSIATKANDILEPEDIYLIPQSRSFEVGGEMSKIYLAMTRNQATRRKADKASVKRILNKELPSSIKSKIPQFAATGDYKIFEWGPSSVAGLWVRKEGFSSEEEALQNLKTQKSSILKLESLIRDEIERFNAILPLGFLYYMADTSSSTHSWDIIFSINYRERDKRDKEKIYVYDDKHNIFNEGLDSSSDYKKINKIKQKDYKLISRYFGEPLKWDTKGKGYIRYVYDTVDVCLRNKFMKEINKYPETYRNRYAQDTLLGNNWRVIKKKLLQLVFEIELKLDGDLELAYNEEGPGTLSIYYYSPNGKDLNESSQVKLAEEKNTLVDWLAAHEQAYQDACAYFNLEDLNDIDNEEDFEKLLIWISEHETVAKDFENYFNIKLDLDEEILNEAKWNLTLNNGSALRKAISEGDLEKVSNKLLDCYKEIIEKTKDETLKHEAEQLMEDMQFALFANGESGELDPENATEDDIDYYLSEFYDLCDAYKVWVELDESVKTSLTEELKEFDEWESEDIDLWKSIDWKARNYEEYDAGYEFDSLATLYSLEGKLDSVKVPFHKFLRSNPIYPPYYRSIEDKPFQDTLVSYVGPMYNGNKHGIYDIHDRYETEEAYNALSN